MELQESQSVARRLITAEIGRIVTHAHERGGMLRTGFHAARLFVDYPDANFSIVNIADELAVEAGKASVPVQ
jgi:hypothetical protein